MLVFGCAPSCHTLERLMLVFAYLAISIVCVGISVWSTYYGLKPMAGWIAAPAAAIVGLGLWSCDYEIMRRRLANLSLTGPVLTLILFMLASGSCMFAYFYTNLAQLSNSAQRLDVAARLYDQNLRQAEAELRRDFSLPKRHAELRSHLSNMESEVTDPGNEGWGSKARGHLDDVYKALLPQRVATTQIPPPRAPADVNLRAVETVKQRVIKVIDDETAASAESRLLQAISDARKNQEALYRQLNRPSELAVDLSTGATRTVDARAEAIDAWDREIASLARRLNQIQSQSGKPTLGWTPSPMLTGKRVRLAGIADVLEHVSALQDPFTTGLSLAAAAFFDLIPLLFALLVLRPVDTTPLPSAKRGVQIITTSEPYAGA
jgi:hypothetical protein